MNIADFELFKQNSYTKFVNNGREFLLNREPYLDVVLNDYCNGNCKFCIADLIHEKLNLDFEIAKKKVLFAVENMRVKDCLLLGGEPTVSKLLLPFIKFLKTLPLEKVIMTTNGIRLARDEKFREEVLSSGLTNINISFMCLDFHNQQDVTEIRDSLTVHDIKLICKTAREHGVKVRINNNVYKGNNDTVAAMCSFYEALRPHIDSIKFSPLLKTDAFSVLDVKTRWVKDNILSDDAYDYLFSALERHYTDENNMSIIVNQELFGFVKNSMIPLDPPIILNWNQHGQMMSKVVNEHKINNLKLLPNNELSLSWNREMTQYFIDTN